MLCKCGQPTPYFPVRLKSSNLTTDFSHGAGMKRCHPAHTHRAPCLSKPWTPPIKSVLWILGSRSILWRGREVVVPGSAPTDPTEFPAHTHRVPCRQYTPFPEPVEGSGARWASTSSATVRRATAGFPQREIAFREDKLKIRAAKNPVFIMYNY